MAKITDSQYGGVIRIDEADFDNDEALDAQMVRALINNATHLKAEDAHVRLAIPPSQTNPLTTGTVTAADGLVKLHDFGPIHMRRYSNGTAVKLRVRIYGRLAAGSTSGTLYLHVGDATTAESSVANFDTNVLKVDMSSTTWGWMTTKDSGGTAETLIEIPRHVMRQITRGKATIDDIGGDPTTVRVCTAPVSLWFEQVSGSPDAQIGGLYMAEVAV